MGDPDLGDLPELELFSGDPGLDLDGELLTGELVVEDFVEEDIDILAECDLSSKRESNLSFLEQTFEGEVGVVGDFDESAGDLVRVALCSGVMLLEEGLAGEGPLSPPPLEELLSLDHCVVSDSNAR